MPTITTVARLANVSVASASRVLNGIRTSPDTLARVTEAAEAVGYVPNAAARILRSRRTGQIAFAMPDVGNPVYTTMVRVDPGGRPGARPAGCCCTRPARTPRTSSRCCATSSSASSTA